MEDLISRISGDSALREALRSQLCMSPASTEDLPNHVSSTNISVTSQSAPRSSTSQNVSVSISMDKQHGAADIQPVDGNHQSSSNDSSLVAQVHQSDVIDAMNANGRHQIDNDNSAGPLDFDLYIT